MATRKKKSSTAEPVLPGVNPAAPHTAPDASPPFPIVALGASAGGLDAFRALLKALPDDTGMAFIMLLHLPPSHDSALADILRRVTRMPVSEVDPECVLAPDHVYVALPGHQVVVGKGRVQSQRDGRAHARPIDHLMRSLAEEHGHKSIGVVLSGTGNDGSRGLEEIKAAGGITFAQDASAEQTGMPRSAVALGAADFVLSPAEIAAELQRISRHPCAAPADVDPSASQGAAFARVLDLVRQSTGVDFSSYKRNTLHRRITRRMILHKIDNLREYVQLLQGNPQEVQALHQDVLINVTSFFRNPDAYEALKTLVFPRLAGGRPRHDPIRIWTLGCSTGEEAYSVAMCYTEYAEGTGQRVPLQVFATDVNGIGIEKARAGLYTKGIAQDVSADRLRRFFVEVDGGYRISKPIRDMCVFARQNALADPPFSRIDLVACRNMLIYLEPVLQQRLIRLLHYALKPEGFMWLGASETIGSYRELFEPLDLKHKVYGRRAAAVGSGTAVPATFRSATTGAGTNRARTLDGLASAEAYSEADRAVLSRYSPPGALVNEALEVLQFRGDMGAYLAPASGRASLNVLKMLREDLVIAVRAALHKAKRDKTMVREQGLRMRSGDRTVEVDVVVLPVGNDPVYLVLFEEPANRQRARVRTLEAQLRAATQAAAPASADRDGAQQIARLSQELSTTREYLQSVIEEQEAANEELQSANEEVQSANEELQSINEELETSKEEIQSANEELATVNDELQDRNRQLSEVNNDLSNLIASANMAIVMLGPDLRIRRFTQAAEKILNLIGADIGRPFDDIRLAIDAPELTALIGDVIENVTIREREVQDHEGRWYSLRVRPYRTFENKIDGAVMMLVDVDNLKRAEHAIRESEQRFEALADTAAVLIWVDDLDAARFVNRAFQDFVGATEPEIRRTGHAQFVHPDERDAYMDKYAKAVQEKRPFDMRLRLRRSDGAYRWMKLIALPRIIGDAKLSGFVGCAFDITDMEEAEAALSELDRGKTEFLAVLAHELRNPLSGVSNASRLLEHAADAGVLAHAREIIERQTKHMVRMIDDLLDLSRLAYGKIRVVAEPVEVTTLLRSAIEETAQRREEVGQTLSVAIPEQPLFVLGDAVRLDQVFSNLLANASKFTRRDGRIWLNVEKEHRRRGSAMLAVRIRDNGVGIDKRLLPRVFDLFVQGDSPPERTNSGIGLGLTLAKRLVDLHGGTIEAHSAGASLGSEFVVRLPLLQDPAGVAGEPRGAQRSAAAARRILVVDDNFDSGDSLRMLLARMGHDVRLVGEGGPVPAVAAEFRPDLIVLDIGLPDMDGYSVARALRADARTKDAFIVAVTGYGRDEDRARSLAAGIDDHMTKPVDPDALMQRVYAAGGSEAD